MGKVMQPTGKLTEQHIFRRIEFLLSEARCENPVPDQAIKFTMRVISNFYTIGRDAGSAMIKKRATILSKEALRLKSRMSTHEWLKNTINEHQEPLDKIWKMLVAKKGAISIAEVVDQFKKYPMVVVTREEDSRLRAHHKQTPEERYRLCRIEIVKLDDNKS